MDEAGWELEAEGGGRGRERGELGRRERGEDEKDEEGNDDDDDDEEEDEVVREGRGTEGGVRGVVGRGIDDERTPVPPVPLIFKLVTGWVELALVAPFLASTVLVLVLGLVVALVLGLVLGGVLSPLLLIWILLEDELLLLLLELIAECTAE